MKSQWIPPDEIGVILKSLMPMNALACEVSLRTGLRIGDCLALTSDKIRKQRFNIKEEKTGKTRNVYLPKDLQEKMLKVCGRFYVFEHRTNSRKHRTRQAVFKDLVRSSRLFRCKAHVTPHSLRKIYAVEAYNKSHDMCKVKKLLNHSDEAVTMIYALADHIKK